MLQSTDDLETPAGRRFGELGTLVQSYLLETICDNSMLGAAVASQLLSVLTSCDNLSYSEVGTAEAYTLLHFLDRYHRFQLTYSALDRDGLMPLREAGVNVLDIGTGPGPSMFAVSDFYSERGNRSDTLQSGLRCPAFSIDYVEQSLEFRRWPHHFTEYANFNSPMDKQWYVPYHHGTFFDFKDIEFDQRLSSWEPDGEGGVTRCTSIIRHRFDLIILSNFLTSRDQVKLLSRSLRECARFLRNNGIIVVVGSASSKYEDVYDALSATILEGGYSSRKFVARCEKVPVEPSLLSYRWGDPFGKRLKEHLRVVYAALKSAHAEVIPAKAARKLDAAVQPAYNKKIEWQVLVFRKRAWSRRRVRRHSPTI